jgi:hypothetical protein
VLAGGCQSSCSAARQLLPAYCLPACLLRLKAGPLLLPIKLNSRPLATPTFPPLPQALRLFVGVPVWTPHNRPADDMPSRSKYLQAVGQSAVAAA